MSKILAFHYRDMLDRSEGWLTLGIVMVLMIDLVGRSHKRKVSSEILPRLGLRMESGTI